MVESLNGVEDMAPRTDGVTDLNGIKIEPASNLDGTVDTIYKPKTQQELDQIEAEEYQGPPTLLERVMESDLLIKAGSVGATVLIATGAGPVLFPTEAKAETRMVSPSGMPSQAALEGYSVDTPSAETKNEAEVATPAPNPEPVLPTPEAPLTEHYAERQKRVDEYKNLLRANECQEINLEACANWIYAVKNCDYFSDPTFVYPEKTKLSNYVTVDQVVEFGQTGKVDKKWNWKVIYHKDENGKKTKEPGLMYAFNPENKVFSEDNVQAPIDSWEKVAPGFFRVMNDNDEWVLLHSDACDPSNKIQVFKYGKSIIYCNYSSKDSGDFENFWYKMGVGKEQFGVRGDALGIFTEAEVGLMKARLAVDCCKYIFEKTGNKFIAGRIKSFQMEVDTYTAGMTEVPIKRILDLISEIKSKNLMTPYGAATWAEIDGANATAKAD